MGVKSTDTDKSYLNVFNSSVDDRYGPLGGGGGGGATGPYGVSATGGSTYTPGNGYKYHKFAYPSSTSFVVTDAGPGTVDVLLVGGGGGAGPGYNSGAGGGGVVHHSQFPISVQTYPVTIGNGGANPNSPGADFIIWWNDRKRWWRGNQLWWPSRKVRRFWWWCRGNRN